MEGIITKWVTRWRAKGGVGDLRGAIHAIEKLIEVEQAAEERSKARAAQLGI